MTKFSDIFTNPARYKQHGLRKYSVVIDDLLTGIVLATQTDGFYRPALNKAEFDGLLEAKREGRIAEAYIVVAQINGRTRTYCGEIEAERLVTQLNGVVPRTGQFGEFYVLPDHIFVGADAPF
jgi:hypothetical protein